MPNRKVPAAGHGLPGRRRAPSKRQKEQPALPWPAERTELEALYGAPLRITPRRVVEATVARLIDLLDRLDPDPDLEPSLGSGGCFGAEVDIEYDDAEHEADDDAEPSLGDPIGDGNQEHWGQGGRDDREETFTLEDAPSAPSGKTYSEILALRALEAEILQLSARIQRRQPGSKRRPPAEYLMLPVRGSCR